MACTARGNSGSPFPATTIISPQRPSKISQAALVQGLEKLPIDAPAIAFLQRASAARTGSGSGTSTTSSTCSGNAQRKLRPYFFPALRPGSVGMGLRPPSRKSPAWRFPARSASSNARRRAVVLCLQRFNPWFSPSVPLPHFIICSRAPLIQTSSRNSTAICRIHTQTTNSPKTHGHVAC